MKAITTTEARKEFGHLVLEVQRTGQAIGLERHGRLVAYLSPAPQWNSKLSDTTNLAAFSGSFDFLLDEPDVYHDTDLKKRYA